MEYREVIGKYFIHDKEVYLYSVIRLMHGELRLER
mgnify:CR=1 FL=1|jgi:hypothetical protein